MVLEFDELLTLVRRDMFFPGSICLYRDIPWIGISIYWLFRNILIDSTGSGMRPDMTGSGGPDKSGGSQLL
jgi:hypothetical protein